MIMSRISTSVLLSLVAGIALLTAFGCSPQAPVTAPTRTDAPPLRLLVIGDPGLAKIVKREWDARSEGELNVRELTEDEFKKWDQPRLAADAVLFPSPLLGELASRDWLVPIPDEALDHPTYQFREIFAAIRKQELIWEEQTYAVPLGGPPLLLFYRKDIFDSLNLKPPATWLDYRELAERLADRERVKQFVPSAEAAWSGTCEPLKDQWAAAVLLARAAPYAKHRSQFSAIFDYRTMQPLIDGPPFVRALQELSDAARFAPPDSGELTPSAAVERLNLGQSAMAIGWLAETKNWNPVASTDAAPTIGVVALPGSRDAYNFRSAAWEQRELEEGLHVPLVGISGRLGALTTESRQPAVAVRLLTWLSGPEMSVVISTSSASTAPFRASHIAHVNRWTGPILSADAVGQYAQALQQSLSEPHCLSGLRIPGHTDYLNSLADEVRTAIAGKATPEASLATVAKRWGEISTSLGLEKQRHAYMRSIGLKP